VPRDFGERKRERRDAANDIARKVADVVERVLEDEHFKVADIGRLFTTRYDGHEIDVGIKFTFHRKTD
jgi:hypothetical protein